MLKDITIGQHVPGNSIVHRMDPRIKILLTIMYLVVLLIGVNPVGLAIAIAFTLMAYMVARIPLKMLVRSLKPLVAVLAVTGLLQVFFTTDGKVLFSWWIFTITWGGVRYAIMMMVRIVCLIAGTGLLTYTTSPILLTDAIERLLSPLKVFKFPAHELAMMMTIALRFIPTLVEETDKIMSAQKARGAELDSGKLTQRVKALIPILIPLFLSAFRRAYELATAMECRCYHGGDGRTRLRQLKIRFSDILIMILCIAVFAAIAFSGRIFPGFLAIPVA